MQPDACRMEDIRGMITGRAACGKHIPSFLWVTYLYESHAKVKQISGAPPRLGQGFIYMSYSL